MGPSNIDIQAGGWRLHPHTWCPKDEEKREPVEQAGIGGLTQHGVLKTEQDKENICTRRQHGRATVKYQQPSKRILLEKAAVVKKNWLCK